MRGRVVVGLALVLLVAGFATAGHGGVGGWGPVAALMAGVPCTVPVVDDSTSANLKWLTNVTFPRDPNERHGELDIHGHYAVVARFSASLGFDVVDLSEPLNPTHIGRTSLVQGGLDVKFSPDGSTVFVGNTAWIEIVDVQNPANPVKTGRWFFPAGPAPNQNAHMLYTSTINGQDYLFVAPNSMKGVFILRIDGPPGAKTLTMVSQSLPVEGGPLGPHDMWVTYDNDLGKYVLYVADAFHGWLAFDVSNPALPLPLGGFVHPSSGYTHTVQAAKIGNRRIVVTIEEVGVNFMKVYDATNLLAPVLLGVWQAHTLPNTSNVVAGGMPYDPQHNFQIVGGKVYMAHDGWGFYILDLNTLGTTPILETQNLKPVAHYAATNTGGPQAYVDIWDVVIDHGMIWANHRTQGLQLVGYGCNTPGDPSLMSTG